MTTLLSSMLSKECNKNNVAMDLQHDPVFQCGIKNYRKKTFYYKFVKDRQLFD